ncbi:hypothetical protein QQP08_016180 [Theobroma cacao]|nr:hypothetical protein QQP08_016180 [Theobroma cacao]
MEKKKLAAKLELIVDSNWTLWSNSRRHTIHPVFRRLEMAINKYTRCMRNLGPILSAFWFVSFAQNRTSFNLQFFEALHPLWQ